MPTARQPDNAMYKQAIADKPAGIELAPAQASQDDPPKNAVETGGVTGPEPTRYGDWEKNGRCVDF